MFNELTRIMHSDGMGITFTDRIYGVVATATWSDESNDYTLTFDRDGRDSTTIGDLMHNRNVVSPNAAEAVALAIVFELEASGF